MFRCILLPPSTSTSSWAGNLPHPALFRPLPLRAIFQGLRELLNIHTQHRLPAVGRRSGSATCFVGKFAAQAADSTTPQSLQWRFTRTLLADPAQLAEIGPVDLEAIALRTTAEALQSHTV